MAMVWGGGAPAGATGVGRAAVEAVATAPALPAGARVLGALPSSQTLHISVALRPEDPVGLQALATSVSTPGSPDFRHYLTPDRIRARFGQSGPVLGAVRSWLAGAGLTVGPTTGDGLLVPASGSPSQVEAAFSTTVARIELPGRTAYANLSAPEVPAPLAPLVQTIGGLADLVEPAGGAHSIPGEESTSGGPGPGDGAVARVCPQVTRLRSAPGGARVMSPVTVSSLYAMGSLYQRGWLGQGVTVGLFESGGPYDPAAISLYEQCFGVDTPVVSVPVAGGSVGTDYNEEATLDIEDVIGLAPGVTIRVYNAPEYSDAAGIWATMLSDDQADVISSSYAVCEADTKADYPGLAATEDSDFQMMALQGQSLLSAAGDQGSEACIRDGTPGTPPSGIPYRLAVNDPPSQPFMTAVGGTMIRSQVDDYTAAAQVAWNQSGTDSDGTGYKAPFDGRDGRPDGYPGNAVGSGGISSLWPQPAWQVGDDTSGNASGVPCRTGPDRDCRELPDVAALAGLPGYAITAADGSGWQIEVGTSAASPTFTALVALADDGAPDHHLGFLDPSLYPVERDDPSAFTDIVETPDSANGNDYLAPDGDPTNDTCTYGGQPDRPCYLATPGYDMATGLGTPVASSLVPDLLDLADLRAGYTLAAADGGIFALGGAPFAGSGVGLSPSSAMVGLAMTPDRQGYWLSSAAGGVFTFGDATFEGSQGGEHLNAPVVGMAATPDGKGYWLVGSDGGVFSFGDATFEGSQGGQHLNAPIVGMAATPDGKGYWLVGSDGGVFSFGDAPFEGSTGGQHLNAPVVGMAATPDGKGYWLVGSDGGVFSFGDATFEGSTGGQHLNAPVVSLVAPDGAGYWLIGADGGVFSFGDAPFDGSLGSLHLAAPVVSAGVG
jgi:hypothetical protein